MRVRKCCWASLSLRRAGGSVRGVLLAPSGGGRVHVQQRARPHRHRERHPRARALGALRHPGRLRLRGGGRDGEMAQRASGLG
eukprot:5449762-Pleurochrysis_carterae.AAC.1